METFLQRLVMDREVIKKKLAPNSHPCVPNKMQLVEYYKNIDF